jgi:hypothetical protein
MRTNKLGDMLVEFKDPNTPPSRLEEIKRLFNELSDRDEIYRTRIDAEKATVAGKLKATSIDSDIPITRSITYSFITNGHIPNDTYVDLNFSDSRGSIKGSDACVIYKPGYTDRFILNPIIQNTRSILGIAIVSWEYHNSVDSTYQVAFDFYDANDVYQFSYFSDDENDHGYSTNVTVFYDRFMYIPSDVFSCRVNAYQYSGATNIIQSADVIFMLP